MDLIIDADVGDFDYLAGGVYNSSTGTIAEGLLTFAMFFDNAQPNWRYTCTYMYIIPFSRGRSCGAVIAPLPDGKLRSIH